MSRIVLAMLQLATAPAALPTEGPPAALTLACHGVAEHPSASATRGNATRSGGTGRPRRSSDDAVDAGPATRDGTGTPAEFIFEFDGDFGRVRYPAALIPVVHGGDRSGWWPVRDFAGDDSQFSGQIALNVFNKRRFTIDRRTGAFVLTGGMDASVTGRCGKVDAGQRLF